MNVLKYKLLYQLDILNIVISAILIRFKYINFINLILKTQTNLAYLKFRIDI